MLNWSAFIGRYQSSICGGIGGKRKTSSFVRPCALSRTGKIPPRKSCKTDRKCLSEEGSDLKLQNILHVL